MAWRKSMGHVGRFIHDLQFAMLNYQRVYHGISYIPMISLLYYPISIPLLLPYYPISHDAPTVLSYYM